MTDANGFPLNIVIDTASFGGQGGGQGAEAASKFKLVVTGEAICYDRDGQEKWRSPIDGEILSPEDLDRGCQ